LHNGGNEPRKPLVMPAEKVIVRQGDRQSHEYGGEHGGERTADDQDHAEDDSQGDRGISLPSDPAKIIASNDVEISGLMNADA
jgi:hypothetical protein